MENSALMEVANIFLGFFVMVLIFSCAVTYIIFKCTPIIFAHLKSKVKMLQSRLN